ncbi:hypothetical protein LR48_Vigan583s000800 [Vigna angularis]|uniref:Uncharacterized protein n=1 Tax=Phaseolus angularis TaxID=3914 RepID=A0A0L9TE11_PHAAN|nr:hypothetical protein LR48_Vigan583s000800 [Vigna angularis]
MKTRGRRWGDSRTEVIDMIWKKSKSTKELEHRKDRKSTRPNGMMEEKPDRAVKNPDRMVQNIEKTDQTVNKTDRTV